MVAKGGANILDINSQRSLPIKTVIRQFGSCSLEFLKQLKFFAFGLNDGWKMFVGSVGIIKERRKMNTGCLNAYKNIGWVRSNVVKEVQDTCGRSRDLLPQSVLNNWTLSSPQFLHSSTS